MDIETGVRMEQADGSVQEVGYQDLYRAVYSFAKQIGLPHAESEDVAQEVCVLGFARGALTWRTAWQAARAAYSKRRRAAAQESLQALDEDDPALAATDPGLEEVEARDLREALAERVRARAEGRRTRPNLLHWAAAFVEGGEEALIAALTLWRRGRAWDGRVGREPKAVAKRMVRRIRQVLVAEGFTPRYVADAHRGV